MRKIFTKAPRFKEIPFYIFFDVFNIVAAVFIVRLYNDEVEIWYISYFFVFVLFCIAVFLKQYDKDYLKGLNTFRYIGIFEWAVLFVAMLFPGWLAGGAFLGMAGFSVDEITSYNTSVLFIMPVYPLIFGLFPFRKALLKHHKKLAPLSKKKKIIFKTIPDWIIFILSIYLLVFYFDILSGSYESNEKETMDLIRRVVFFAVAMLALLIIYMPARMHFFFTAKSKRNNIISLIITVILISLYSMTGINLF